VAALAAMKDLNELEDGLHGNCSGFGDRSLEQLPFSALKSSAQWCCHSMFPYTLTACNK